MINNLQNFHFLHPLWLLILLPLAGLLWLIFNHNVADNAWHKIIDQNLLPFLLDQGNESRQGKLALWLLATAWLIATLALANPVWEKKPQPVFQTNTARVIVFDLSRSMEIADLAPSRLARARFKIEDILRKNEEGQIGLVVFAGDAFTAVPLTRDADTIRALLPSLIPKIMPIQGSRADLGLLKAAELLQQAGVNKGDILLISDGVEGDLAQKAAQQIAAQGHTLSVMAVGTKEGGAIPNVTDRQHNTIVVKLETKRLQAVAKQGGGAYSLIQDNDSDLDKLLSVSHKGQKEQQKQGTNNINSEAWHEQGPLLVLLLLPLAALAFRRGWLLTLPLVFIISIHPRPVLALDWDDLWLRADQQADKAFRSGEFETASKIAQDPMLRGNAAYQQGNYQQAVDAFSTKKDANALYNKGNALAKLGHYKDAIAAYDNALQQQPDFADATANKKYVAALLKKQEEKKQQQNKKDDTKDDKKSDQSSEKKQNQQDKENKASDKQSNNSKDQQNESKKDQQKNQEEQGQKKQGSKKKDDKDSDNKAKENAFDKATKEKENKEDKEDKEKEEKSAQEKQAAQQTQTKNKPQQSNGKPSDTAIKKEQEAEQLSREEKIAAEQWLRRIEDNPGDLLQRKFKYQYQQRQAPEGTRGSNPW